ncbi:MAG TPA: NEW3 domain-containing protein [Thermodesulfobacteriota bacterium]|nr:NEW3 domain-containing protein [Thermodesulfobacteriota bacterium]
MWRVNRGRTSVSILLFFVLIFCLILSSIALAQEEKKDLRPERGIAVFPEFSGVIVPKGETVRMDLILENKGRTDETIDVKISNIPKGWKASLKGGSYVVSGLYVPNGKTKNMALTLEPDKTVESGAFTFQFDAQTADGKLTSSNKLNVTVQERTAGLGDIQITTSYPVLRGQTDAKFEFSLEIMNKIEADRTFNLAAIGPEKWEINFKPAYEQKQISSLRIKGGTSQSVAVEVTPQKEATPGEYPVLVRVTSGERKAEVKLMVVLTGIYKLDAGTPSGVLSLEAIAGKPANFSFYVKNTGSAVNRNVTFSSFKPENWEVTFKPEKIDALEPGALKQVEVTVKPAAQALVGDYSVGVLVNGEKSDKTIEMRVTVKASTAWGWIGIGIIIFVIAGLSALFIWLGRR